MLKETRFPHFLKCLSVQISLPRRTEAAVAKLFRAVAMRLLGCSRALLGGCLLAQVKIAQLQNSVIQVTIVSDACLSGYNQKLRKHKRAWVHNRKLINYWRLACTNMNMLDLFQWLPPPPHDKEHMTTDMKTNHALDQTTHSKLAFQPISLTPGP